jgi:phthalate 4,5-dioxygenase reductase subunit
MSTQEVPFRPLLVSQRRQLAPHVVWFELRDPANQPLAPFSAGAHITVLTPAGLRRNYSLCGDPAKPDCYQIAVRRDPQGRGGSLSMADQLGVGSLLQVSAPRNNFVLDALATQFLFIAGGIGITPILSMMRQLKRRAGASFKLIYCTRDVPGTAFAQELAGEFPGQCLVHHDGGDPACAFDLWPALEAPNPTHVYCCGPQGLMDAVADMSGHWPSHQIHFESFGVDARALPPNQAFAVRLQASQATLTVSAEETLLQALRRCGHEVPSSCESGTCGTCRTRLIGGTADHRDMVLMQDEKATHIMVCVSRAQTAELVLDL